MLRYFATVLKILSLWGVMLTLCHVTYAETLSLSLKQSPQQNKAKHKVIQFVAEFNHAKIVRDLIPTIDKYLQNDKDKSFLKDNLGAHMLLEAPELRVQGDLITLLFEAHKKTLEMRLNLKNMKLYVKDTIIDLHGMTAKKLVQKLSELKLVASTFPFSILNQAHAAFGLAILAVSGIGALVVGILAVLSSWSKKSCFARYQDVYRTFETVELNCLNDLVMVSENPQTKLGSETLNYINIIKQQMKTQKKSKLDCKKEVSNYFKYFSYFRKKTCLPSKRVGIMCEKMKSVESCLREFEDLDTNVISQQKIRVKIPSNKRINSSGRNSREQ
jgi:hypothetical protein